ncbi:hypothetical protein ACJROX_24870 [Pseudalkalibacillus sp. A8]|uniref:hypothetical protein n=1 Tax=Pseudalkalibacillus sp. A8 TaxID=3382641 RepID=UPI0038B4389E
MAYQPKSYRKFMATSLTAAMAASVVAPTIGSASESFSDVLADTWYAEYVNFLVGEGHLNNFSFL